MSTIRTVYPQQTFQTNFEKCLDKEHASQVYTVLRNQKYCIEGLERYKKHNGGSYADIYQGRHEGREVCVKELRCLGSKNTSHSELYVNEITIWSKLKHPNILPFLGTYINGDRFCLVSPWMVNGNLKVYSQKQPYNIKVQLLLDVAKGLEYLHSIGIIHGDLKAENILVSDNGRALIGDFGLSHEISSKDKTDFLCAVQGTMAWMAPEVICGGEVPSLQYWKSSDIWSFGCVVFEVMEGKQPHAGSRWLDILQTQTRRKMPGEFQEDCRVRSLGQSCWEFDPTKRPSATALRHQIEDLSTL